MSFLNQSSKCYNGNDLYSSNKREDSSIGVLEFEDIFDDLDLQNFKKSNKKYEKNNSLHVSLKKISDDELISQTIKEKARTETIQNQSSFHTTSENNALCTNFGKLNSFYSKALNLNKNPLNEEAILNPFQKKKNSMENSNINKSDNLNNLLQNHENNLSLSKMNQEKNIKIDKKYLQNKKEINIEEIDLSKNLNSHRSSNDESQNIVSLIKHLSMCDYPETNKKTNIPFEDHFFSFEDFQKVKQHFFFLKIK